MSSQIFTDFHLVEISINLINKAFNPLLPLAFCLLPSAQRYSCIPKPKEKYDMLLELANNVLYQGKHQGRDRITLA